MIDTISSRGAGTSIVMHVEKRVHMRTIEWHNAACYQTVEVRPQDEIGNDMHEKPVEVAILAMIASDALDTAATIPYGCLPLGLSTWYK